MYVTSNERSIHDGSAPVERVELFEARVPLSELARGAMAASDNGLGMAIPAEEPWLEADFLFCRLVDEDGVEGWGEAYVWLPESGVATATWRRRSTTTWPPTCSGSRPIEVQALAARMDRNVARNEMAKGLLDIACHELAARQIGRPVHDLIGGATVDRIPLCGLIPLASPATVAAIAPATRRPATARCASSWAPAPRGPRRDRGSARALRRPAASAGGLQPGLLRRGAARALALIEPFGIDAAEQPLPVGDLVGMVDLARRTNVPLFLHEGFFTLGDLVALVEAGGCGVVGINGERPGGITAALRAIDYASARGLGTIIHNQPLGIGTAMHAHLAAARFDRLGHAVELAGDVMFDQHLTTTRYAMEDGHLVLPGGPGWGIDVDRDALDDHLVAAPISIGR